MSSLVLARGVSPVLPAFLALAMTSAQEVERAEGRSRDIRTPLVLDGYVVASDGAPAEGAVVVSSAGGSAVTDVAGRYRLEVEVPLGTERLQLTALRSAGRSETASASVPLDGTSAIPPQMLHLAGGTACVPTWLPEFGGMQGVDGPVNAMVVFDDGSGPALHVGGGFRFAGGVAASCVAKWNGESWSALGSGLSHTAFFSGVLAMAVYDDGGGPALFVGGDFTSAGGSAANRIAKWDGVSWSALAGGANGAVRALTVHEGGAGPALYAGGEFTSAGGVAANRIARWDGTGWAPLGTGMNHMVHALLEHDDGGGPALFAGGRFTSAGGIATTSIARWDGAAWTSLGSGIGGFVYALAVHTDPGGPAALIAGGNFGSAGGLPASRVARWDGSAWAALGAGLSVDIVYALASYDEGAGAALYAASVDAGLGSLDRWDGTSWSSVGTPSDQLFALAVHDDGGGAALFTAGVFTAVAGVPVNRIARWRGSAWSALGDGAYNVVRGLAVHDDGGGPALHVAFEGGATLPHVARWTDTGWTPLSSGMDGLVRALAVYDDGGGERLHAAGEFTTAGGVPASRIARWTGSSWASLGSGIGGLSLARVNALAVHDDGSGPALYAAGSFTTAGGLAANGVARWNGTNWSAVGSGVSGATALAVLDDGGGAALIAASASRVWRWNGSTWSALGGTFGSGAVFALAVHDGGSGPTIFAAGSFTSAEGVSANRVARWTGTGWEALGSGANQVVWTLASHQDGASSGLYAGGEFTLIGGLATSGIARWTGSTWTGVGSGTQPLSAEVFALWSDHRLDYPALYVAGSFARVDSGDSFVAKWSCGPDVNPPELACPASVTALERLGGSPGELVHFTVPATDDRDPAPEIVCVPPSGTLFAPGTTWVDCTATDDAGNQSTCSFPVIVRPKVRPR